MKLIEMLGGDEAFHRVCDREHKRRWRTDPAYRAQAKRLAAIFNGEAKVMGADFGQALAALKKGGKVKREGDQWPLYFDRKEGKILRDRHPEVFSLWLPHQEDILATDWEIL